MPHHHVGLLPALVLLINLAAALPASAAAEYVVYTAQAETFRVSPEGFVGTDHVSLGPGGFAWRDSQVPPATRVSVRVRATTCPATPAPTLVLSLGGLEVASWEVADSGWEEVEQDVVVAGGLHWVALAFSDNGPDRGRCERQLDVDVLHLHSAQPTNTATPGSQCVPTDGGLAWVPPSADLSTTVLGSEARAYYEVGGPTGDAVGLPAKGVMLVFHGGGWFMAGPRPVVSTRGLANFWRGEGWVTVNATTRGCGDSVDDALWFADKIRELVPWMPICTVGSSAGAHLALMVAGLRADVDCAISHGGPTDLAALATQDAWIPPEGPDETWSAQASHHLAVAAFGASALADMSPLTHAETLANAHVVVATAVQDQLIPPEQGRDLETAIRAASASADVERRELSAGSASFVHAPVSFDELVELIDTETALADRAANL